MKHAAWPRLRAQLARLLRLLPARRRLIDQLATADHPLLRVLFEDSQAGAVIIDRQGRVVRMNALLRDLLAGHAAAPHPPPPAIGVSAEALFARAGREAAWDAVTGLLAGRLAGPAGFATRLAGAADAPNVSVAMIPLREADQTISGAILRFSDITLQKQLEAQLAQSQKLQAVGQLAGGIAHDFNNLLTAVIGAADSMAQRDGLDPEMREDIAQIRASAGRGAALVRQLLAFGRQQTLQPRVVPVNAAITDLAPLLRRLLGTGFRLELELEPPGRAVKVDPSQFDQVLVNLAVNARDAMPDGGTLTVRSGHITLFRPLVRGSETIPPGRYVMIEVADTGAGIPPDVLARIFDPFFTTKREGGGHGLGLSTVHGIIRQSDGYLGVASEPGAGTAMRIYLPRWENAVTIPRVPAPAAATPAAPAAVPPAAVPPAGARVVLLVEDEDAVRRLAERSLVRHGWTVLSAESGEAALALLGTPPPALAAVITDMVMPGMDGGALVRAVRQRLAAPTLPALLVSGYAEETLRRELDATATAFLPKPYSLKELVARLAELTATPDPAVPSRLTESLRESH
jgi:two-component system cell cycle sensor histidine kinase/response regulator CckA